MRTATEETEPVNERFLRIWLSDSDLIRREFNEVVGD